MANFPKILIGLGFVLIVIGLLWQVGGRYLGFGRLPGDIVIERENFRFYFPLMTSVLLSVLLSLLFYFFQKFSGR